MIYAVLYSGHTLKAANLPLKDKEFQFIYLGLFITEIEAYYFIDFLLKDSQLPEMPRGMYANLKKHNSRNRFLSAPMPKFVATDLTKKI